MTFDDYLDFVAAVMPQPGPPRRRCRNCGAPDQFGACSYCGLHRVPAGFEPCDFDDPNARWVQDVDSDSVRWCARPMRGVGADAPPNAAQRGTR